ncbi:MAG: alpha/beta hydrolase, partial [Planctomycetota bacterium]
MKHIFHGGLVNSSDRLNLLKMAVLAQFFWGIVFCAYADTKPQQFSVEGIYPVKNLDQISDPSTYFTVRNLTLFSQPFLGSLIQNRTRTTKEQTDEAALRAYEQAVQKLDVFNGKYSRVFQGARVPIHYLEFSEKGIPLVLLHGTYSTSHDFSRHALRLVNAGYRPISVDWYGHGKTLIPEEPVSATDFSVDLSRLLDSLDIERAVVAGHSRGGALASDFYKEFPDRVSGLILIDGGSTHLAAYFAGLGEAGLRQWLEPAFDLESGLPKAPTYDSREDLFAAA